MKFLVETSARHLHVSKEHLETLFGEGFELSVRKDLSQPGQFASGEKVQVVGPRGQLNVHPGPAAEFRWKCLSPMPAP